MTFGMRRDLVEVLTMAQLDDAVRVVVITATGRGFCAGMYLSDGDPEPPTLAPDRPDAAPEPVNLAAQLRLHLARPGRVRSVASTSSPSRP